MDIYVNCPKILDPSKEKNTDSNPLSSLNDFSGSENFHHELIGYHVIINNRTLHNAVRDHYILFCDNNGRRGLNPFYNYKKDSNATYNDEEVDKIVCNVMKVIGNIVVGDYSFFDAQEYQHDDDQKDPSFFKKYSAMVQLIHSEMDADNIDYLLRDATFSGTTYGTMDMGILISSLTVGRLNYNYVNEGVRYSGSKYLVGVLKKRIGCVEQFLISKYMAYGQVVFNKYVSILEAMLFRVACKLKVDDPKFSQRKLKKLVESRSTTREFLEFNDSYILNRISSFQSSMGSYYLSSPDQEMVRQINDNRAFNVQEEVSSVEVYERYSKRYFWRSC